ncbi:UvrD-helicase domain-containing protein [Advenella sp. S44]|uniref:UvrD-helicase domain-containing protein n=1 Tax=Advenella sp. S44 TaxID=1982755 RepID=UPI0013747EEB|nr:UvrD-helicase domain-containing protein [Advenella sp. S44]
MQNANEAFEPVNEAACLARYADLFDSIERTPLTQEQRLACISNAPATLVLAGAGTGKTSTLTGRAAFLMAHGLARPADILCLAFAREAALEIQDRMHSRLSAHWPMDDFAASTFHSLGLHIVREVEKQSPALADLCGNRQKLNAFVDKQIQQLANMSDEYAGLLFEYFSVIDPGVALSCEFATRADYQAHLDSCLMLTIQGEVVRYPVECLVANALCIMGVAYDYRKHYPYSEFLGRRRPYQCIFHLSDIDVYVDVFDCTERDADQCAMAALARRLVAIHRRHGTRHIILWEDPQYLSDISYLIDRLRQELTAYGVNDKVCIDMACLPHTRHNTFVPESGTGSVRDCLRSLVGTVRWRGLVEQIAAVLPLYRQFCAQAASAPKETDEMRIAEHRRIVNITALVQPLVKAYGQRLRERGQIDFDDMIARATQYVSSERFIVPWRDVLIDEFQDISSSRFALIAAMLRQRPQLRLFCVGDDWQAIYRFAGSQIRYSTHFRECVHSAARIVPLSRTFRFNQILCDVSSRFLMKNPFQNRKQLHAASSGGGPVITLVAQQDGLAVVLSQLQLAATESTLARNLPGRPASSVASSSVLILARFKHLLPDSRKLQVYAACYPHLRISATTVHASKGLEADYVCILNMEEGTYGFPSRRPADKVLEHFLPKQECFDHADERRLFYVALTRARKHVWLLVPREQEKMSVFVKELMRDTTAVLNALDWRKARQARKTMVMMPQAAYVSKMARKIMSGKGAATGVARSSLCASRLTNGPKRSLSVIVDKIKRDMISLLVSAEK